MFLIFVNSLLTDHYDVFTFLVAVEKLRLAGQMSDEELNVFCKAKQELTCDNNSDSGFDANPEWIDSEIWKEVLHLDTMPGFQGLKEAILSNTSLWKEYFEVSIRLKSSSLLYQPFLAKNLVQSIAGFVKNRRINRLGEIRAWKTGLMHGVIF